MGQMAQNAKKRRIEQTSSTLSKPFKSPLRKPTTTTATQDNFPNKENSHQYYNDAGSPQSQTPEKISSTGNASQPGMTAAGRENDNTVDNNNDDYNDNGHGSISSTPPTLHASITPTTATNKRSQKHASNNPFSSPLKRGHLKTTTQDPVIADLLKKQRTLQTRLLSLRSELDTASQALRIESSNTDAEIGSLVTKWRAMSQDAADEVFEGARERVARMGGVSGWKKQRRQQQMKSGGFGWDDSAGGGGGSGDDDVDSKELEARKTEMLDQLEVAPEDQKEKDREVEDGENDEEDEEFTMDMMLGTLNVDLKIIGFDKANQRWVKD